MIMDRTRQIDEYFESLISVINSLDKTELAKAIAVIEHVVVNDGNIYVIGNGGSSATASHIQNDWGNTVRYIKSSKINIHCLSDNVATITAIANDYSYDLIYLKQLEGRITTNDLLIAISGSGNSVNILKAVEFAKTNQANVIAMTGFDGGLLKDIADFNLYAPVNNMQLAEDVHIIFNHVITHCLKEFA